MKHSAAGADVDLIDLSSLTEDLGELVFHRRGGADGTISGHFVDLNKRIIPSDDKATWTYTGTVGATVQKLATILGVAIPETAVGFRGFVTGNAIIVCALNPSDYILAGNAIPAGLEADMNTHPERYMPILPDPDILVVMGRA